MQEVRRRPLAKISRNFALLCRVVKITHSAACCFLMRNEAVISGFSGGSMSHHKGHNFDAKVKLLNNSNNIVDVTYFLFSRLCRIKMLLHVCGRIEPST